MRATSLIEAIAVRTGRSSRSVIEPGDHVVVAIVRVGSQAQPAQPGRGDDKRGVRHVPPGQQITPSASASTGTGFGTSKLAETPEPA